MAHEASADHDAPKWTYSQANERERDRQTERERKRETDTYHVGPSIWNGLPPQPLLLWLLAHSPSQRWLTFIGPGTDAGWEGCWCWVVLYKYLIILFKTDMTFARTVLQYTNPDLKQQRQQFTYQVKVLLILDSFLSLENITANTDQQNIQAVVVSSWFLLLANPLGWSFSRTYERHENTKYESNFISRT